MAFRIRDIDDRDYFPPDDREVFEFEWVHEDGSGRGGRWVARGKGRDFVEALALHYPDEWEEYAADQREHEGDDWEAEDDWSCSFKEYLDAQNIGIMELD